MPLSTSADGSLSLKLGFFLANTEGSKLSAVPLFTAVPILVLLCPLPLSSAPVLLLLQPPPSLLLFAVPRVASTLLRSSRNSIEFVLPLTLPTMLLLPFWCVCCICAGLIFTALSIAISSFVASFFNFLITAGEVVRTPPNCCWCALIWSRDDMTSWIFFLTDATNNTICSDSPASGACRMISSILSRAACILVKPDCIFSMAFGISADRTPTSRRITRVHSRRLTVLNIALEVRGDRSVTLNRDIRLAYSHPSSSVNPVLVSTTQSDTHVHSVVLGKDISSLDKHGAKKSLSTQGSTLLLCHFSFLLYTWHSNISILFDSVISGELPWNLLMCVVLHRQETK
mmetsp:Transcript_24813/g.41341  ORF Transcript_24813/g.41341 Transcript_24813/m.41341 type:complete len:343 (-) Transcript_24813:126-1154(-)